MKHLIETTNPSGLTRVDYDRIVLDSTTNEIAYRGGVTYEYVDLGLPSRLKWAKCNIGATSETDYGYYFQWGDIVDKSNADCTWETYKHCNGSNTILKKYITDSDYGTVDNKTTLDPEDDAATQIMGGKWRMPTKAEWQELLNNTTNEWTQVNGYKFTSKKEGFQNNSIFIPASGARFGSSFNSQGNSGGVWSSSLDDTSNVDAWFLDFYSYYISDEGDSERDMGLPVRGVRK